MTTYTTRQVADATGKTVQAISRYALSHPGFGRKAGRDWLFTEAEYRKLLEVRPGRPRKRRRRRQGAPQPGPAVQEATA